MPAIFRWSAGDHGASRWSHGRARRAFWTGRPMGLAIRRDRPRGPRSRCDQDPSRSWPESTRSFRAVSRSAKGADETLLGIVSFVTDDA